VLRLFAGAIDGSEEAMHKDAEMPSAGMMAGLPTKVVLDSFDSLGVDLRVSF